MPAPKDPITKLADDVMHAPSLVNFKCLVLVGAHAIPTVRSNPSIVMYPFEGGYSSPQILSSLIDVDLTVVAWLWGANIPEAWDLRVRFIQALRAQSIGNYDDSFNATPDQQGLFYSMMAETWDISHDTAEDGQALEVIFAIKAAASPKVAPNYGQIDSASISPKLVAGIDYAAQLTARRLGVQAPLHYWPLGDLSDVATLVAPIPLTAFSGGSTPGITVPPLSLTRAATFPGTTMAYLRANLLTGQFGFPAVSVDAEIMPLAAGSLGSGVVGWNQFGIGYDAAGHFVLFESGVATITSPATYATNREHHVCIRWNGGTTKQLWVNGVLVGTVLGSGPAINGQNFYVQDDGFAVQIAHVVVTEAYLTDAHIVAAATAMGRRFAEEIP